MKNLVFPRIFLHCVAPGFIVSGLLLSGRPEVQILYGTPKTPPENPVKSRVSGVFSFLREKTKIVKFTDFH